MLDSSEKYSRAVLQPLPGSHKVNNEICVVCIWSQHKDRLKLNINQQLFTFKGTHPLTLQWSGDLSGLYLAFTLQMLG